MKITINHLKNNNMKSDEVKVKIEYSEYNEKISELFKYINNFNNKEIVVRSDNELKQVSINDIIYFYSDKKYNYCKTVSSTFKIKSKLYEIEKMNNDFIRISKCCVINVKQVKCFDIGETGKIVVKFYDNTEETVSRRKIKDVMNYLDERSI